MTRIIRIETCDECPHAAELCRQAIERDHRWKNLAEGLTGGWV